jgi:hypothetical protein
MKTPPPFWILLAAAAAMNACPEPAFAQQVTGFRLWDAAADRPISSVAAPGATLTVSNAQRGCVAVEILTDAALQAVGPGSLRKTLDGGAPAKENSYPYAWEDDGGSATAFNCASTLSTPGRRVLSVEPFSGDDWTGATGMAAAVTIVTEDSCVPAAHGLSCPGVGTRFGVSPIPDDALGPDRTVGLWSCCGSASFPPPAADGAGTATQSWPVPAGQAPYAAFAWSCLNTEPTDGTPRCASSPVTKWGYLDAVPLPEPAVTFGALMAGFVAIIALGAWRSCRVR